MNDFLNNYNRALFNGSQSVFRINNNAPYKNTLEEKQKIIDELYNKFLHAESLSKETRGTKNLLYFAVFGATYIDMLELLLNSIKETTPERQFDIMFITDEPSKELILALEGIDTFVYDFHIVPTPVDGVAASICKILITDYAKINDYKKILFLDTDYLAIKNINVVFEQSIQKDKLEVVLSSAQDAQDKGLMDPEFKCMGLLSHSLGYFTPQEKEDIFADIPKAFNAGQYLLHNTESMLEHFKNVQWLTSVWPSLYYFEQSFLNHYFGLKKLFSTTGLKTVSLVTSLGTGAGEMLAKWHEDSTVLLHFCGMPTQGHNKYRHIQTYRNYFKI